MVIHVSARFFGAIQTVLINSLLLFQSPFAIARFAFTFDGFFRSFLNPLTICYTHRNNEIMIRVIYHHIQSLFHSV